MKASVICASLLAGFAVAAPEPTKKYNGTPSKPTYDKDCDKNGYYKVSAESLGMSTLNTTNLLPGR